MLRRVFLCLSLCFPIIGVDAEKKSCVFEHGASNFRASVDFWPEVFFGKNLAFLNDDNHDRVIYFRHLLDLNALYIYGKTVSRPPCLTAKCTIRSRCFWGDSDLSFLTNVSSIQEADLSFGEHLHGSLLCHVWVRELWIDLLLNEVLGLNWCNKHRLTCGAFPFELGRGIALGTNYGINAPVVGFFFGADIDQFVFGAKLSGKLSKKYLAYDLYGGILSSKNEFLGLPNRFVYGRGANGLEGLGFVNYVFAGRLLWYPFLKSKVNNLFFEPYIMYNHSSDIKMELLHDAKSNLVTIGCMGSFEGDCFDAGFEYGFNRGGLDVFGIDRDKKELENRGGTIVITHDHITDDQGQGLLAGHDEGVSERFRHRNPFRVRYRGSFFVADASYYLKKDTFKVSAGFGISTGDSDPRRCVAEASGRNPTVDYEGFIPLNDIYTGRRVNSFVLLNGYGSFPRILDFGENELSQTSGPNAVSGFSNLIYVGVSCEYFKKDDLHTWHIFPNLLFFWQDQPSSRIERRVHPRRGDRWTAVSHSVDPFLGTELNILLELDLVTDLSLFFLAALFIPGDHFKSIQGAPLSSEQESYFNDRGLPREPFIRNDKGFLINGGLKYAF